MKYRVLSIPLFDRQFKRLLKKFPSLKNELKELSDSLEQNPEQGVPIGKNCYKIRIAIASKGKGKSGGARVITNIVVSENNVYLLTIYDKSEKATLDINELNELFKNIPQ
ncbi:MAG: hypothetical protein A3H98_11335 [Bacteroidetes bacterium RIFCSPLOWO2_02_FULL_36_8]|nr:MAG: hypothetical protein A3H98_11335 [Bacteroidetes bacterium RIFCSPLOWO2_02_FULL_36_8]OFY69107.1 MAG: hypothetical protein A3G23_06035 [Bacteroidetes bacterium RIFCSPLOWO2_12_FULL_37_12]